MKFIIYHHRCASLLDEPVLVDFDDDLPLGTAYVNEVLGPPQGKLRLQIWLWVGTEDGQGCWKACRKPEDNKHPTYVDLRLCVNEKKAVKWVQAKTAVRTQSQFTLVTARKRARRTVSDT